jgi:hypothetical protein
MRTEVETEFFRPYLRNSVFGQNFSVFFFSDFIRIGMGEETCCLCCCAPVRQLIGPMGLVLWTQSSGGEWKLRRSIYLR